MRNEIQRYDANKRSNYWAAAVLSSTAGLSGLALFHPALFWLANLFGGGPWTRTPYPFLGPAMFVFFLGLVACFVHHNRVQRSDIQRLKQWRGVVSNCEENLPEVSHYNTGQKPLFWVLLLSMLTLLVTGVVIWCQCSSTWLGIEAARLSALLHASAAFVPIASIIVHIYAGIWVKGSMGAMLYSRVNHA